MSKKYGIVFQLRAVKSPVSRGGEDVRGTEEKVL
jgi:hypothetical protein